MNMREYITEAIQLNENMLFEMANVVKSKSGLDVDIWSEHTLIKHLSMKR